MPEIDHANPLKSARAAVPSIAHKPRARFVLDHDALDLIYPSKLRRAIIELIDLTGPVCTGQDVQKDPSLLRDVEVVFSGWGGPCLTEEVLDAATDLRAIFYGAGSVRTIMTDAAWQRGIKITSAASANAIPVVEYTCAQIVFCLKRIWQHAFEMKQTKRWQQNEPGAGGYGSTVGIVSAGEIGRRVIEKLLWMDINVLVYDPNPSTELIKAHGLRFTSLEELFAASDVISIHTPLLDSTQGLIDESLLSLLKPGASLINTARGAVIDEPALIRTLHNRPDLFAILDVTDPEPPTPDNPLWTMPNVVLTPHIAGSRGGECARMGRYMLEELRRYRAKEPLKWLLERDLQEFTA